MAELWMPGLRHDPGRSAGYNAGRNRMYMVIDHDTGGSNSYNICKWGREGYNAGLCQILLPKQGVPWQFCEIDAICYHAGSAAYGNYNDDGPGFEVERLQGEPLSADQTYWLGQIGVWLQTQWGVPNVHYWGPRFPAHEASFHGHVNHRDVHPNPDGLSPAEWAAVTNSSPLPISEDDNMDKLIFNDGTTFHHMNGRGLLMPLGPAVAVAAGPYGSKECTVVDIPALAVVGHNKGVLDTEKKLGL